MFISLGLTRHAAHNAETNQPSDEEIWLTNDAETAAHWINDELLDVSYITVRGVNAAALADSIRSELPMDDIPKLQARAIADRDPDVLIDTLYRTAIVACSSYDPKAFALLRWGLNDPNPLIRRVSLLAVSITGWESFAPTLDEIIKQDPVDEVRDQAARVRDALKSETENPPI
ncbi:MULTISPECIES: HEAT repeat domain-containing protein [unclassified Streptomyces]|uniref:HEAT repeat domain-containing protein n=1 Tax=unclassified Streptomyces TaxID=2593676 RepID=UPI0022541656|nr:HEAT repeat domain-containing protein [Streptomyces sp. NBC_01767]MCX4395279.1 HEAT repeat domain-containing protein [Streptomyces sp. NBC_01767]WSX07005.1 HEAT repeat domain-containing protein [Streptomyces sp. NBC_00987]